MLPAEAVFANSLLGDAMPVFAIGDSLVSSDWLNFQTLPGDNRTLVYYEGDYSEVEPAVANAVVVSRDTDGLPSLVTLRDGSSISWAATPPPPPSQCSTEIKITTYSGMDKSLYTVQKESKVDCANGRPEIRDNDEAPTIWVPALGRVFHNGDGYRCCNVVPSKTILATPAATSKSVSTTREATAVPESPITLPAISIDTSNPLTALGICGAVGVGIILAVIAVVSRSNNRAWGGAEGGGGSGAVTPNYGSPPTPDRPWNWGPARITGVERTVDMHGQSGGGQGTPTVTVHGLWQWAVDGTTHGFAIEIDRDGEAGERNTPPIGGEGGKDTYDAWQHVIDQAREAARQEFNR